MVFQHDGGVWNINGHVWSDGPAARVLAKPKRGSIEIWELINKSGGWTHPIHTHLIDFQIISRTGGSRPLEPYEKVALKDVVWLGPNEQVDLIARFSPWDGVYMFHCHNLIHEVSQTDSQHHPFLCTRVTRATGSRDASRFQCHRARGFWVP